MKQIIQVKTAAELKFAMNILPLDANKPIEGVLAGFERFYLALFNRHPSLWWKTGGDRQSNGALLALL
jgi:hypothetical protein